MRWPRNARLRAAFLVLGLLAGCGPGEVAGQRSQQIVLDVTRLSSALSQSEVQRVGLSISGTGISPPITTDLARWTSNAWSASVTGIPAGPARLFQASAFDAQGTVIYEGETSSDVLAGAMVELTLVLQDPPPTPGGGAPRVSSVEASQGQVPPSTPIEVRVVATGDSGQGLSFAWNAECPGSADAGVFLDRTASSTTWTAPAAQPLTCALSVSVKGDQGSSSTVYLPVRVTN